MVFKLVSLVYIVEKCNFIFANPTNTVRAHTAAWHIYDKEFRYQEGKVGITLNTDWIEPTLHQIKETLLRDYCPEHSSDCEEGNFIKQVGQIMSVE